MNVIRKKIRLVREFILAGLFLCACPCFAQVWPVHSILDNVKDPVVLLKDKSGTQVDLIQRSWVADVEAVTTRIAQTYELDTPRMYIAKQNGPNAFVTLDHGVPVMVVNTDMLRVVGDDQAMLAVVIGHELGHLKAGHLTQGRNIEQLISLVGLIAGTAIDLKQARRGVYNGGLGKSAANMAAELVNAKFNRDQEREADDLGVRHMAQAGYDPEVAPRFWRQMQEGGMGGSGLWLDSHPSSAERNETVSQLAVSLKGVYAANKQPAKALPDYDDPYPPPRFVSMEPTLAELSTQPVADYATARALFKEGQTKEAYPLLLPLAAAGDERAQDMLGAYAQSGMDGAPDHARARDYFSQAAAKGLSLGIVGLGLQSYTGKGATLNYNEAARLLCIAAHRNEPRAKAFLSLMYLEDGKPFARDPLMASELAESSAAAGDWMGRAALGLMLREGMGTAPDKARSFALLNLAANDNNLASFAQYQLAVSYEKGAGTAVNKDRAIELYRQAASHGFAPAVRRLTALGLAQ